MRYIIKIYKDKELINSTENSTHIDWDFLNKYYTKIINNKRYIEIDRGGDGSFGYALLYNTKTKKNEKYRYTIKIVSDFKNKKGRKIIVGKNYKDHNGNICNLLKIYTNTFYLRIYGYKDLTGYVYNYKDISGNDLTQEYIDKLELI